MSVAKATKETNKRACETCNSTKHYTAQCNKARQTDLFVASLVTGDWHNLHCVVRSLDRVQLKALLTTLLSNLKEMRCVPNKTNKPVSKMTNAQLARECVHNHRMVQEIQRENAEANIDACPICMENLMPSHAQCKLACGHSLHTGCYSNMLVHNCQTRKENNCPLCRKAAF
ncbi:MAG: hypothetical protein HON94_01140 [Methylococcales bacterium]|jgi:hypothetical protein|nr:hypothetical protein [Methylococcales bacterium]